MKIELDETELLYLITGEGTIPDASQGVLDRLRGPIAGASKDPIDMRLEPLKVNLDHSPQTVTFNAPEPIKVETAEQAAELHSHFIESEKADELTPQLDKDGIPWDKRIHASSKALLKDGCWRRRRNLDVAVYQQVKAELLTNEAGKRGAEAQKVMAELKPSEDTWEDKMSGRVPPPPPPPTQEPRKVDFGALMDLATKKGWDYPKLQDWATKHGLDGIMLIMGDEKLYNELCDELETE